MGRFIVSDNLSIDGVLQDPAGDEGFERGGWVGAIKDRAELGQLALDDALGSRRVPDGPADLRVVRESLAVEDGAARGPAQRHPQVRRLVDARAARLERTPWSSAARLLDAVSDLKQRDRPGTSS